MKAQKLVLLLISTIPVREGKLKISRISLKNIKKIFGVHFEVSIFLKL